MKEIRFSDGSVMDPETLVYVELEPENETQEFNEDVWNYVRKGPDRPTLVRIKAGEVNVGEKIFNLDGSEKATRIS